RQHSALRFVLSEEVRVDGADSGDQAVGRGTLDQVLDRAPLPLRRYRQGAVLDEGPRITEVGDVLTGGSLLRLPAPRHGVRPRRIQRSGVPSTHFREVGTRVVFVT